MYSRSHLDQSRHHLIRQDVNNVRHYRLPFGNVERGAKGLRAFAQSGLSAGLDLVRRKPCDDFTRIIIGREHWIENFPNKTVRCNDC